MPKKMQTLSLFQPNQIVCLEAQHHYLYGEVVQVISERGLCWVHPLILAIASPEDQRSSQPNWIDLRYTSDLFYPITAFRPALDTEVMPLISYLMESEVDFHKIPLHRSQLNAFLKNWLF